MLSIERNKSVDCQGFCWCAQARSARPNYRNARRLIQFQMPLSSLGTSEWDYRHLNAVTVKGICISERGVIDEFECEMNSSAPRLEIRSKRKTSPPQSWRNKTFFFKFQCKWIQILLKFSPPPELLLLISRWNRAVSSLRRLFPPRDSPFDIHDRLPAT